MPRVFMCGLALLFSLSICADAAVPTSITVQGKLTDSTGVPFAAGLKQFVFSIHDSESGGTKIWPSVGLEYQMTATDASGLWSANVGASMPLNDLVFLDSIRWLEVAVDIGGPVVLPRVRLVTGPYTYRVSTVDGASGGTITSQLAIGPGHSNAGEQGFAAGANNNVRGAFASVSGGQENIAFSDSTHVGGGGGNTAFGLRATIGGGANNETGGDQATVAGGRYNKALGLSSTVGGGFENIASGVDANIGGGSFDSASGNFATVAGGTANKATGNYNTIGGGGFNRTAAASATVAGGFQNVASADDATVGGGFNNKATGFRSVVPGGTGNQATAAHSFACGVNAISASAQSFVWNDDPGSQMTSTAPNQFIIGSRGGVGIGTGAPEALLHVHNGSAGVLTASANTIAAFERNTTGYLSILTPGNTERGILFGEPTSPADGGIVYDPPANPASMNFRTGGNATRMTIDSVGRVGIGAPMPATRLHVVDPTPAGPSYMTAARFESVGHIDIEIVSPTTVGKAIVMRSYDGTVNASIATAYDATDRDEIGFFIDGLLEMYLKKSGLGVNGDITAAGCVIGSNIGCPSDARLKKNVETLSDPIATVKRLHGVRFEWKDDVAEARGFSKGEHVGLIAQDVQTVVPDAVLPMSDGHLSVDYSRLVPILIEAIKEQQKQIDDLRAQLSQSAP